MSIDLHRGPGKAGGGVVRAYVNVPWGQVHYRWVPDASSRLPWLLLSHPTPMHSGHYGRVLPHLAKFVRPVAVDTPGFGMSDPTPGEWEASDYGRGIWQVADALGMDRPFLYGRATGAVFTFEAALQQPERPRGLLLHGLPAFTPEGRARELNSSYGAPYEPREDGSHLQAIWDRVRSQYPSMSAEVVQWNVEGYLAAGPDFASAYRALWRYDLAARLDQLKTPSLIFVGDKDRTYQRGVFPARETVPGAEWKVLKDVDDFIPVTKPVRFASIIEDFVVRHAV